MAKKKQQPKKKVNHRWKRIPGSNAKWSTFEMTWKPPTPEEKKKRDEEQRLATEKDALIKMKEVAIFLEGFIQSTPGRITRGIGHAHIGVIWKLIDKNFNKGISQTA